MLQYSYLLISEIMFSFFLFPIDLADALVTVEALVLSLAVS